jgi:hypothetical protein
LLAYAFYWAIELFRPCFLSYLPAFLAYPQIKGVEYKKLLAFLAQYLVIFDFKPPMATNAHAYKNIWKKACLL